MKPIEAGFYVAEWSNRKVTDHMQRIIKRFWILEVLKGAQAADSVREIVIIVVDTRE